MKHYVATVQCPKCGHTFTVCVHNYRLPEQCKHYDVLCPMNRSVVRVPASALQPSDTCPKSAVIVR